MILRTLRQTVKRRAKTRKSKSRWQQLVTMQRKSTWMFRTANHHFLLRTAMQMTKCHRQKHWNQKAQLRRLHGMVTAEAAPLCLQWQRWS